MDDQKTTAGQGLGIAGLVLGILAMPLGIIPCTFFIAIALGVTGIVLSAVALSQANRANGRRDIIIAALICSILGFSIATTVGFGFTRKGIVREIYHEDIRHDNGQWDKNSREVLHDMENDTTDWTKQTKDNMKALKDTLKSLEGENKK